MGAVPKFGVVALDCPDPVALAEFYRELQDWGPAKVDDGWVSLPNPGGGAGLAFQRVPDYRAPDWPSTDNPQQLHLDLYVDVDDIAAAVRPRSPQARLPREPLRLKWCSTSGSARPAVTWRSGRWCPARNACVSTVDAGGRSGSCRCSR